MKISDIDVIFISFDEPNADINWADLLTKAPWAKRVHGVKGSDNAHKAAANLSTTDWFVTVDGDNIVDTNFFNIEITESPGVKVYGWSGENVINGLRYGNGGLKVWNKDFVLSMKTHEAAESKQAQVDFCWEDGYKNHPDVFSMTVINHTPYQAWRAGFREGVKMALLDGVKVEGDLLKQIYWHNIHRLKIWSCIGSNVHNGIYSMLGARAGTYMTYCTDWDYVNVRDFEYLSNLYETKFKHLEHDFEKIKTELDNYAFEIKAATGLSLATFDETQSNFLLEFYKEAVALGQTYYNKDPVWKNTF